MTAERRRYFRIDDTVGVAYQVIDGDDSKRQAGSKAPDVLAMVSPLDEKIERLLLQVAEDNPKVAELVAVFNQKLERIVNHLAVENQLVNRIAHKVKEANISACGIAFYAEEKIAKNARLKLDLTLFPDERHIATYGRIIDCDPCANDKNKYFWRIDFYGMRPACQEVLIQHIVRSQSQLLRSLKDV